MFARCRHCRHGGSPNLEQTSRSIQPRGCPKSPQPGEAPALIEILIMTLHPILYARQSETELRHRVCIFH
jgi:hypothetical protein